MKVQGYAALSAKSELVPFEYELGTLGRDEVEVDVQYCGLCHSDLSMLNNDWQITQYPFIPGHEVVGKIVAKGDLVQHLAIGQTVGIGWFSRSCMVCDNCMNGNHNLCATNEGIIVGRFGGFANKVRVQSAWATPLPSGLNIQTVGPLFCGGITVFNPLIQLNIKPTDSVGVVGIGGLGHMALAFLRAWGCEVTAFSTSPDKAAEAKQLGAHHFVATHDLSALEKIAGTLDMILVTVNVELLWQTYLAVLKPKGRLHIVGAAPSVKSEVFPLLMGQKSISGSPLGSPATTRDMLKFAARHHIQPIVETFKLANINDAFERLKSGKARYRIVLEM